MLIVLAKAKVGAGAMAGEGAVAVAGLGGGVEWTRVPQQRFA